MASALGESADSLESALIEQSYKFDFYQAVKLLEKMYLVAQKELGNDPDKIVHSENFLRHGGAVKFKSNVDPAFPASSIDKITFPYHHGDSFEMSVNFLGLAGLSGPLPAHYTQWILDLEKENPRNTAFRDFLDIFNNKLIYLMYRIRRKYRIGFDARRSEETVVAKYILSLIGLGTEGTKKRLSINDTSLLRYTSLLAHKNHSVAGFEFILSDYFRIPVKIESFIGKWREIPNYQLSLIGSKGQNNILGQNITLGYRNWDQAAKFNVRVGPLTGEQFYKFLPLKGSDQFKPLLELTRYYAGADFDFDFTFIVRASDLHATTLGDQRQCKLGWTTWIPPKKGSIFDCEYLLFVEADNSVKMESENGERLRLGWTVWVPDEEQKLEYIEVRISRN